MVIGNKTLVMSLQAIRVFTAGVGLVQIGLYHSPDSLTEEHVFL